MIIALGRVGDAPDPEHFRGVALAEFAIAGRVEMQEVEILREAVGRDDMGRGNHAVERVDNGVVRGADAAPVRCNHLAHQKRNILGLQLQILQEILIDGLHVLGPDGVTVVGLALVHQDAGDDPLSLSLLRHRHEPVVRMAVISRQHGLHPLRRRFGVLVNPVRQEAVDADAADGDMHHTHLVALRKILKQGTAEIVDRRESGILAAQRREGFVPLPHFPGLVGEIHGRQVQEGIRDIHGILRLDARIPFHVGLAEAEENMEILVLGGCGQYGQGGNH